MRVFGCIALGLAVWVVAPVAHADPPWLLRRDVVARAVDAACTHAGVDPREGRALVSRARASGWLPTFSARYVQGLNALDALNYQALERTSTTATMALDFRVSVNLAHGVFHPSEVGLARMELRRLEMRRALQREVIELLAALAPLEEAGVDTVDRARLRAMLEATTGLSLEQLRRP